MGIAVVALALPASAAAARGDLVGQSCISKAGTEGCAQLPEAAKAVLEFAGSVVVSPDGRDVYVGAAAGIAHFRRAADGSLTYANCVDTDSSPSSRCPTAAPPDASGALTANAISLAISPDGRHIYAVSWADALLWWVRDLETGDLSWGGCRDAANNSDTNLRCGAATTFAGGNFPKGSMDFSQGIAVTADGDTIYIADQTEGLLQAQRNETTGAATPTACFNNTSYVTAGCTGIANDIPMALSSLALASNSRDVYVRSISPGGITHFSRTAGGVTSFTSCVAYVSPSTSCASAAPVPVFQYSGAVGVAGDTLFTHGGTYATPAGTTARFAREEDGTLTFEDCATNEASPGSCATLPAQTTAGAIGSLLVTPDGGDVYLPQGGTAERALTRLTGSLEFASCLSDTGLSVCSPAPLPGPFAAAGGEMALSPDGRQIYQGGENLLNTYAVAQSDPPPVAGPPPADDTAGPRRARKPRIRSVKRDRRGRYRIRVKVFDAGALRALFKGKLKRKAKARRLGRPAGRRVRKPGVYTLKLKPSAVARRRRVRARLIVTIAPKGLLPARATRAVRLR